MPDPRSKATSVTKHPSAAPERTETTAAQAGVVPRWLRGWRGELVLLSLVLLGIAIFFAGYGVGMKDDRFRTHWYSPLRGSHAASLAVGSVQGHVIDRSGNTPLLVTVRGLPILAIGTDYTLSVLQSGKPPRPCGYFGVGAATTQVHLSCPNLPVEPSGWLVTVASKQPGGPAKIMLRSPPVQAP